MCMTLVVGAKISATGRVIVGHNEDDGTPLYIKHGVVPARDWTNGSYLPAEAGCCTYVPQVAHTLATYWSEVKFKSGDGCADNFTNEKGVTVVSNSGVESKERYNDRSLLTDGGVRFNIRRAVAERAENARDGARIICELVGKYGYASSARIYTVADKDEAWQIQIVNGKNYVAFRCPDDAVTIMPNMYTIHELSAFRPEDIMVSPDLLENAKRKGFWDGIGEFDFAKAYQKEYGTQKYRNSYGRFRQSIMFFTGAEWPADKPYPYSIKPSKSKISVDDLKTLLSAHNPPSEPGHHVFESFSVCAASTVESSVCEFANNPKETRLHVALGHGCEKPYITFRPFADSLPAELDDTDTAADRLDSHVDFVGEIFELKARPSMTPVELNAGDVCRFTLVNGETRTIEYIGGESSVLEIPATEGLIATLTMHLKIDGVVIPFRRYFATQESMYEPAVVDGLRIFPDVTLEYLIKTVPMRYPSTGPMRHHPWKDCRIVIQDATLPLCPEKLQPWFRDKRWDDLFIPIGDCYHGGDCWLGPFAYGQAHGGMDVCMPLGDLLYAPFACNDQWMPLYAKKGRGTSSRWRGTRRFSDGTLWSINTSHVVDTVVDEHTPIAAGQAYCTAAGTAVGEYNHTHFELHISRDLNPPMPDWDKGWGDSPDVKNDCPHGQPEFYNLDPWMLFWQTFVQLRDERGLPVAEIAPFNPAKTGEKVVFRSSRNIPNGMTAIWTFNDGAMHTGAEVEHIFARPGAYKITLTLTDGHKRVRDTAIIAVAGEPVKTQMLGLKSDDVSFVELVPGDLPAWGEKIRLDPFTVRDESEIVFFDRISGNEISDVQLLSAKKLDNGAELRSYSCGDSEPVEVFVKLGKNAGKIRETEFNVAVTEDDGTFFHTPCFWVMHSFKHKRRWYESSGGRSEIGQFARFMPKLRAGKWRIEETYTATHQPNSEYWIKVKAKDGIHRIKFSPLKNICIGEFEFNEGEGYVQIESEGAIGSVFTGALRFIPIELGVLSYLSLEDEKKLKDEKADLEAAIRKEFAVARASPETFNPEDWKDAVKVLPSLVGYSDGLQFFEKLTGIAKESSPIKGSKASWHVIAEWLVNRCWSGPHYDLWMEMIKERDFDETAFTQSDTGIELRKRAQRLADIIMILAGEKTYSN